MPWWFSVVPADEIGDRRKMHVKSEEIGWIDGVIEKLSARGIGLLLTINAVSNQSEALAAVLRIVFNVGVGT